jgi:hypothetical protein
MTEKPDVVTIAISRADGGTTIKRLVTSEIAPTPENIEAELAKRPHMFAGATWEIVPNDYVDENTDRTFRAAWVHARGRKKPDHDMPKAREIHRVHLRRARLAEFDRLDNDYRMADEAGDAQAKKDIAAVRQKFRDVTDDPRIEAAQTVEELKALKLAALVPETLGVKSTDKMRISPAIPKTEA